MIINDLDKLRDQMGKRIKEAGEASIKALTTYSYSIIVNDYVTRIQQSHYPLRDPSTKKVIESLPPNEIISFINQIVKYDKGTLYIEPKTEADKSGRMQELYGGKPWQKLRTDMQNLDIVNKALNIMGMKGIKAIPK